MALIKALIFVALISLASGQSGLNETNSTAIGGLILKNAPMTSDNRIFFDMPDLTLSYTFQNSQYQLEAYKSADNDKILQEKDTTKYSQLLWVSLGHPRLIKTTFRSDEIPKLFHFSTERFYTYVSMLTDDIRAILAAKASEKYKVPVSQEQIVLMPMSDFNCNAKLFSNEGKKIAFNGLVKNFKTSPLQLDFWIPAFASERTVLLNRIESDGDRLDLAIDCVIASQGRMARVNTLTISASQIVQMDLTDQVFGDANSSYVSRDQLTSINGHVYNSLNIVEDYEMSEYEFSQVFIDDFIKQTSATTLAHVSLEEALASISKYAISFVDDLKPDIIKQESGRMFKLVEYNNKSNIVIDEEGLTHLHNQGKLTSTSKVDASFLGLIKMGVSLNYVMEYENEWLNSHKNHFQQLSELNSVTNDDVQWTFEGEKIVPKTLNVARLVRASFSKTLSFSRVRRQISEANFTHPTSLYTKSSILLLSDIQVIEQKINNVEKMLVQHLMTSDANFERVDENLINTEKKLETSISQLNATISSHIKDTQAHIKWAVEAGEYGWNNLNIGGVLTSTHDCSHNKPLAIVQCNYRTAFISSPYLITSICNIDASTKTSAIRLHSIASENTNRNFKFKVGSWSLPIPSAIENDSIIYGYRICWMAIGKI